MSELSHIKTWMQQLQTIALPLIADLSSIEQKADGSPVTLVDKTLEQFLRDKIMAAYPSDGIIGEEFPAHQPQAKRQWIIDPIDGTRALIAGVPTFTSLLALVGQVSAMFQPITGELWLSDGGETTYNDEVIFCNKAESFSEAIFSTTSPQLFRQQDKPTIDRIMQKSLSVQLGEDGYAYGKLAKGEVHLIIESGLKPYDFLPLAPIVQGAGGIITDWQGEALTLQSSGDVIAASSQSLHKQAMTLLNGDDT